MVYDYLNDLTKTLDKNNVYFEIILFFSEVFDMNRIFVLFHFIEDKKEREYVGIVNIFIVISPPYIPETFFGRVIH